MGQNIRRWAGRSVAAPARGAAPAIVALAAVALSTGDAAAQDPAPGAGRRVVEISLRPTTRAQLAVWVESADGDRFETLRLTRATATMGIGNRPGATQMNSGFRWPYGRREGVLPVWAHRRVDAGGEPFRRVIFQNRVSEGHASRSTSDFSVDNYYCLSFDSSKSRRDALDAVTCASTFNSDKGRYATEADTGRGYAEPWQGADGGGTMRPLSLESLYPPRRDLEQALGFDHPDIEAYADDARAAMPRIDAVTMATPPANEDLSIRWQVPEGWPAGDYVLYVEAHTEGDYNARFDDTTNPTPESPATCGSVQCWDYWAVEFGYAYRGQPSVVYEVPFRIDADGGTYATSEPAGYGALHGEDGAIREMAPDMIVDDPVAAPGSGADRLRLDDLGDRLRVVVSPSSPCADPENMDPRCFADCDPGRVCDEGFLCTEDDKCLWACDLDTAPGAPLDFEVTQHPDEYLAHRAARVRFVVPESLRAVDRYELRVSRDPILDEASFVAGGPAQTADLDPVAVTIPTDDLVPGDVVEVDIGGLYTLQRYYVGLRAVDDCEAAGALATGEVTTTRIYYTTVSPCFVATAAYGTPLAAEIGALRRFRDRHLRTTEAGRALVDFYYAHGPAWADAIRDASWLRGAARWALAPVVALARALDD